MVDKEKFSDFSRKYFEDIKSIWFEIITIVFLGLLLNITASIIETSVLKNINILYKVVLLLGINIIFIFMMLKLRMPSNRIGKIARCYLIFDREKRNS